MTLEHDLEGLRVPLPAHLEGAVLAAAGLADQYVERPSALGPLFVAFSTNGVSAVGLGDDPRRFEARFLEEHGRPVYRARTVPLRIERHLDRALSEGRPGRLPVDLRGLSEFQAAVLRRAATIPRGEVRPYAWIAREIGRPAAVRAVGSALAGNPVPVIIPCHRVVRSDGEFGKYSLGEDANKPRLLESEGLDVEWYRRTARRGIRFTGSSGTRIFCHPTCRAARTITDARIVEFTDETAARAAGFRACSLCRPAAA